MAFGTAALAFVAGVLSILSPCVLPILPIVLGAAASEQRWGSAALAAGPEQFGIESDRIANGRREQADGDERDS